MLMLIVFIWCFIFGVFVFVLSVILLVYIYMTVRMNMLIMRKVMKCTHRPILLRRWGHNPRPSCRCTVRFVPLVLACSGWLVLSVLLPLLKVSHGAHRRMDCEHRHQLYGYNAYLIRAATRWGRGLKHFPSLDVSINANIQPWERLPPYFDDSE